MILNVTRKFLISFKSEEGLFVKIGLLFFVLTGAQPETLRYVHY